MFESFLDRGSFRATDAWSEAFLDLLGRVGKETIALEAKSSGARSGSLLSLRCRRSGLVFRAETQRAWVASTEPELLILLGSMTWRFFSIIPLFIICQLEAHCIAPATLVYKEIAWSIYKYGRRLDPSPQSSLHLWLPLLSSCLASNFNAAVVSWMRLRTPSTKVYSAATTKCYTT